MRLDVSSGSRSTGRRPGTEPSITRCAGGTSGRDLQLSRRAAAREVSGRAGPAALRRGAGRRASAPFRAGRRSGRSACAPAGRPAGASRTSASGAARARSSGRSDGRPCRGHARRGWRSVRGRDPAASPARRDRTLSGRRDSVCSGHPAPRSTTAPPPLRAVISETPGPTSRPRCATTVRSRRACTVASGS